MRNTSIMDLQCVLLVLIHGRQWMNSRLCASNSISTTALRNVFIIYCLENALFTTCSLLGAVKTCSFISRRACYILTALPCCSPSFTP